MEDDMHQKKRIILLLLSSLVLMLAACSGVPKVDWELKITGDVENPLTLTFKDLADREQVDLNEIMMEKSTGEDEIRSWSGPALAPILEEAGAGGITTITAVAADGYAVEISADELSDAIIAVKDNGEWIPDVSPDKGPIRLVTPDTPANRWVFQLVEIQVNQ
jgi:DMSO/TMAO reductase YedYZ molybdopterin-dependent catalytic subunit